DGRAVLSEVEVGTLRWLSFPRVVVGTPPTLHFDVRTRQLGHLGVDAVIDDGNRDSFAGNPALVDLVQMETIEMPQPRFARLLIEFGRCSVRRRDRNTQQRQYRSGEPERMTNYSHNVSVKPCSCATSIISPGSRLTP